MQAPTTLSPMEQKGAGIAEVRETFHRLAAAAREPTGRNGCLICNTARESIASEPAVKEQIWLYFDRIERAFGKALRQAKKDGELPVDADVSGLAKFFLGVLVSVCTLARAEAPPRTIDDIITQALLRLV